MGIGMRGIVQALAIIAPVVGIAIAGVALQDRMSTNSGAEPAAIAASAGLVHRNGPVLTLLVDSGAALALTDRAICGDLPCPERAATRYRYRGWDARAGGYRLMVGFSHPVEMILAWELAGDDPILFDGSHLLLHSGGALPQPPPPTRARLDTGLADWLANTAGARDQVEAPRLAKSGGRASRDGANLVLTLADKRKLVLTDVLACGQLICPPEIVIGFEYRGPDAKGRFHAIDEHFYETSSALLFDSTSGEVTTVAGPISFSPDGGRAVAVMDDAEPHGQHDIEVWSLAGAAPTLDYSFTGDGENTYQVVGWDDADHVRLSRGPWRAAQRTPLMLAHDPAGWHLEGGN
jgi:hypothetical protein